MENRTQNGPETLGQAARRLLDRIDARKKKASGGLQRPDKIEPAAKGQGGPASQATGIRAQGERSGYEWDSGQPGCLVRFKFQVRANDAGCPDESEIIGWVDRADREGSTPLVFGEMDMRCRPHRSGEAKRWPRVLALLPANDNHFFALHMRTTPERRPAAKMMKSDDVR